MATFSVKVVKTSELERLIEAETAEEAVQNLKEIIASGDACGEFDDGVMVFTNVNLVSESELEELY